MIAALCICRILTQRKTGLALVRQLYSQGFEREDVLNLLAFVDWLKYVYAIGLKPYFSNKSFNASANSVWTVLSCESASCFSCLDTAGSK